MSSPISRRLAAIVSADVVGYSSLVEKDEAGTIGLVRELQAELLAPLVANSGGRLFKTMGDGMLYEFSSIVAAVEAAVAIQRQISEG